MVRLLKKASCKSHLRSTSFSRWRELVAHTALLRKYAAKVFSSGLGLASFKSTRRPVSYNAHTATHTGVSTDCPYRHTARTGDMVVTHTTHTAVRVWSRYGRYG